MKNSILSVLCLLTFELLTAQTQLFTPDGGAVGSSNNSNIGIGTSTPNPTYKLDIQLPNHTSGASIGLHSDLTVNDPGNNVGDYRGRVVGANAYFGGPIGFGIEGAIFNLSSAEGSGGGFQRLFFAGGKFSASFDNLNSNSGTYGTSIPHYFGGVFGEISGTIGKYPVNGAVAAVTGLDKINDGTSYAGYFDGNVEITRRLFVGTLFTSNGITIQSDSRDQINVVDLNYGLAEVMKIKPVAYGESAQKSEQKNIGFVAQNLQNVIPEAVTGSISEEGANESSKNNDARMGINYSSLIPVLVKSIQELNAKLDEQSKIISMLQEGKGEVLNTEQSKSNIHQEFEQNFNSNIVLSHNIPNPFSSETSIFYSIPNSFRSAQLNIYDLNGKMVKSHTINEMGDGELLLKKGDIEEGIYVYMIIADGQISQTKKMILTK